MTVSCPRCGTRYRLPPRSKLGSDPTYRCVQCRHVFSADAAAEAPALLDDEPGDGPPDEEELNEGLDEPRPEEPEADFEDERDELRDDGDWSNAPPARRSAPRHRPSPPARSARIAPPDDAPDDETFSFAGDDDEPTEASAVARRARRAGRGREKTDEGDVRVKGGSPARFAVRVLLGVTLVYGVASIYLYTHPEAVASLLGRVPMIGGALADKRLSPTSVQLTNVRGEYQRVKGDKLVFVISGTAINNSPLPVKGVQIQGRIVGKDEQRQVVFCGAAPRDVRDLSIREIGLLQSLEPPRDWNLGAGEQANFLVAFVAPPAGLREFSAEVVAVQARPRATAGA